MMLNNLLHRSLMVSLALVLGLAMVLVLLTGMVAAQGDGSSTIPPGAATAWLVMDTAEPVDQNLPGLLAALSALQAQGRILGYDPTPHTSGPGGVPGVQVAIRSGMEGMLAGLPGVLYVGTELPPAPAEGIGILATAVLTGQVTEEANPSTPIADLQVNAYDGVTAQFLGAADEDLGSAQVSNGFYTVTVTSVFSQVRLFFQDDPLNYVPEWYNNKSTFNTADNINIAAGGTITNLNAQLALPNAAITGTVRFTPTNQPVSGANIDLIRASTGQFAGFFSTGADGIFTITNVASDVYKVRVTGSSIAPEFYQDVAVDFGDFQASVAAATPVTLTNNATQSIAMQVDPTAVITGLITDTATTLPLASLACCPIALVDSGGNFINNIGTDANGVY
ncbi:MAG: carboxypeptidase regulatory-like domain-containing protein, partial [Chloroflexi bacterium]|nr:carboxypeptidase regulatory-like domain-containing protein [Chloroflexota bacterium]